MRHGIDLSFDSFLDEVSRVPKPVGRFFSYHPSQNSDAFRDSGPARLIDASTLDGIRRPTSPYYPQDYLFRFVEPDEFAAKLKGRGFKHLAQRAHWSHLSPHGSVFRVRKHPRRKGELTRFTNSHRAVA